VIFVILWHQTNGDNIRIHDKQYLEQLLSNPPTWWNGNFAWILAKMSEIDYELRIVCIRRACSICEWPKRDTFDVDENSFALLWLQHVD
jgi:hypothetical protein